LPDFAGCGRSGRFEGFHSPIVAPYLFEDPFIATRIYPYYLWHQFPGRSILQGGTASVIAMQARVALTDRLAFIATKDGYMWLDPDNKLLSKETGNLNLAGGLKYALWQDREKGRIASAVLRFEFPVGSSRVFQGFGHGEVLPSVTGAWSFGRTRLMGDFGAKIPFATKQSTSLFYHLYAEYNVHPRFSPFVQLSGNTWTTSGDGKIDVDLKNGPTVTIKTAQAVLNIPPFEGMDVLNLGIERISGTTQLTYAVGAHFGITEHLTFAAAYERVLNSHRGLFQQRVTTGFTLEF